MNTFNADHESSEKDNPHRGETQKSWYLFFFPDFFHVVDPFVVGF